MIHVHCAIYSLLCLLVLDAKGVGRDSFPVHVPPAAEEPRTALLGLDGVTVAVCMSPGALYAFGTEELFRAQMRLTLAHHRLAVYDAPGRLDRDSMHMNIPDLVYSIDFIRNRLDDGSPTGLVTYVLTLSVRDYLDYARFEKSRTGVKLRGLPPVYCSFWERSTFGLAGEDDFKDIAKERLSEFLDVFIAEWQQCNSPAALRWLEAGNAQRNSPSLEKGQGEEQTTGR